MKFGLVLYVNDLTTMKDFYMKSFNFQIREFDNKYVVLENKQIELVLLKTAISSKIESNNKSDFEIRESTPLKPVFIINEPIEKIRTKVKSSGGGFKGSETEWEFNGYVVCDGWDVEGNIFQVRNQNI